MLECEALRVQFGPLVAVHDVSVTLRPGHLLGLIGPNGAGKTTFLRAVAGLQPLVSGRVRVLGETLTPGAPIMAAVGFTPDTPPLYDDMTVRTFLRFVAKGYGLGASDVDSRIGYWLERVWLTEKADQKIKGLSRGMRQRVGIARTLLPNPAVVLLDEPAAGLDPAGRVQFRKLLVELRAQGKALVVSSHILSDMGEYCTHIAIMGKGTLLRVGTVGEIASGETAGVTGAGAEPLARYDVTLAHATPGAGDAIRAIPGVGAVTAAEDAPAGAAGNGVAKGGATGNAGNDADRFSVEFPRGRGHAARLLAEMIGRGLPVASFAPEPMDLEQAYLRAGIRQVE
jgi:ABC-2 type transport system ATP-binding protein